MTAVKTVVTAADSQRENLMKKSCIAIVFALMLPASQGWAEPSDSKAERREMLRGKMQEKIKEMDTNNDGSISKAEFMAKAEARFAKMDKNGDGNITQDERAQMRDKRKERKGGSGLGEPLP